MPDEIRYTRKVIEMTLSPRDAELTELLKKARVQRAEFGESNSTTPGCPLAWTVAVSATVCSSDRPPPTNTVRSARARSAPTQRNGSTAGTVP